MSVLIVGAGIPLATALIDTLRAQGDEVRIVDDDPELIERWRSLGARPARGAEDDADLIARAAEGARSVVICDEFSDLEILEELESLLPRDTRMIVVLERSDVPVILANDRQHVILRRLSKRSRLGLDRGLRYETIARIVDAADDIAGDPQLDLDMRDPDSWTRLGIDPSGSDA